MFKSDMSQLVVLKIGSKQLTTPQGKLDLNNMRQLVDQAMALSDQHGVRFVLVSSGAILCGSDVLGITAQTLPEKQAAAAVGQRLLMQEYAEFFSHRGRHVAQILLTKDCFEREDRQDHTKNTIFTLLEKGIVPIINENDTVAVDEIRFGDNDQLSSLVAGLIGAQILIMLSDIDGLYTQNPKQYPDAVLIPRIDAFTPETFTLVQDLPGLNSNGGMTSKLLAAQYATERGIDVVLANGRTPNILTDIFNGSAVCTRVAKHSHGGQG